MSKTKLTEQNILSYRLGCYDAMFQSEYLGFDTLPKCTEQNIVSQQQVGSETVFLHVHFDLIRCKLEVFQP